MGSREGGTHCDDSALGLSNGRTKLEWRVGSDWMTAFSVFLAKLKFKLLREKVHSFLWNFTKLPSFHFCPNPIRYSFKYIIKSYINM